MSAYAVGQTFEFGTGTIYQCVYTCIVIGQIYIASNFNRFFFFFLIHIWEKLLRGIQRIVRFKLHLWY